MTRRILILIVGTCALLNAAARVVVTGVTSDCIASSSQRTAGVDVLIFPKSAQLANLIDSVLKASDDNVFNRFNKLIKYVKSAKALSRTKSDNTGSFMAEIPELDKVIVFGYMETEDNPLYWMYSEVDIGHRSRVSVALDYCRPH
jgi:hypothetical protein